jgi:hypothetical protein
MLISVSGLAGAGKDTFADVLVKKHGFKKIALADSLRFICSEVFNIPIETFLDRDKKDSPMENPVVPTTFQYIELARRANNLAGNPEVEVIYPTNLDIKLNTPRDVLKWAGTEVIRKQCGADIWIKIVNNKIKNLGRVVISDVRFENERAAFKKQGAQLVLIDRPDFPKIDPSENTGQWEDYHVIFVNNEGINELQSSVDLWFTLKKDLLAYGTI